MRLTTQFLSRFNGGQVQILNARISSMYRGQIRRSVVEDDRLRIEFDWMAKMEDSPTIHWVSCETVSHTASLEIYDINEPLSKEAHLVLESDQVGERINFYPPGSPACLDPARVEGFAVPAA